MLLKCRTIVPCYSIHVQYLLQYSCTIFDMVSTTSPWLFFLRSQPLSPPTCWLCPFNTHHRSLYHCRRHGLSFYFLISFRLDQFQTCLFVCVYTRACVFFLGGGGGMEMVRGRVGVREKERRRACAVGGLGLVSAWQKRREKRGREKG